MKFLKYIFFLVLIAIIGIATYVAVQPNSFEVSRERTISAPSSVLYDNVIDFKNWETWSSWVEKEPDLKFMFPEQTEGVGGSYSWEGKDGHGKMKTIAANPKTSIVQELQFGNLHPSKINWTFEPTPENNTKITWKMNSDKLPFLFKATAAFTGGFDNMIGPDFERGLEKLDSIVIADMKMYTVNIDGVTEHGGGFYLYNTTSCKMSDMEVKMNEMMTKVSTYAKQNNITMAGSPFTIYHKWDLENSTLMFSSCIPTNSRVITAGSEILTGQLKPFKAVKTTLKGDYKNLKESWDKTFEYIATNQMEVPETGIHLENYPTDPITVPNPADWKTEIFIEVK